MLLRSLHNLVHQPSYKGLLTDHILSSVHSVTVKAHYSETSLTTMTGGYFPINLVICFRGRERDSSLIAECCKNPELSISGAADERVVAGIRPGPEVVGADWCPSLLRIQGGCDLG